MNILGRIEVLKKNIKILPNNSYLFGNGKASKLTLGRTNRYRFDGKGLDAKHLLVDASNDKVYVYDLDTDRGTFINNQRLPSLKRVLLTDECTALRLGSLEAHIYLQSEEKQNKSDDRRVLKCKRPKSEKAPRAINDVSTPSIGAVLGKKPRLALKEIPFQTNAAKSKQEAMDRWVCANGVIEDMDCTSPGIQIQDSLRFDDKEEASKRTETDLQAFQTSATSRQKAVNRSICANDVIADMDCLSLGIQIQDSLRFDDKEEASKRTETDLQCQHGEETAADVMKVFKEPVESKIRSSTPLIEQRNAPIFMSGSLVEKDIFAEEDEDIPATPPYLRKLLPSCSEVANSVAVNCSDDLASENENAQLEKQTCTGFDWLLQNVRSFRNSHGFHKSSKKKTHKRRSKRRSRAILKETEENHGNHVRLKIAWTLTDKETQKKIRDKAKRKFWSITDDPQECDVLIMGQAGRSFKLLVAIARGIPVVTHKWLAHYRQPLKGFLFQDKYFEKFYKFSLSKSLAKSRKKKIFSNCAFFATSSIVPKVAEIRVLIQVAGGKFYERNERICNANVTAYLVSCESDCKVWLEYCCANKGLRITTPEGIMSAIMRQETKRLDRFLLKS